MLSHYNADEQTNDFENVISRDSIKWERHCREAALERTEGIYGLYPAHNFLTSDDGRLYLLHVKYNCTHNHKIITNGKIDPENVISSIDPLKYIIRKVKEESGIEDLVVVATGGLGSIISKETDAIDVYDRQLTLEGLRIIYEKNRGKK